MRKAFIALAALFLALMVALIVLNQRPRYAGVPLPKSDYQHIVTSRKEIKGLLTDLKDFNYESKKTGTQVQTDAQTILKHHQKVLSHGDYQRLENVFYGTEGIVTAVEAAQKGSYNIDPSVGSALHNDFTSLIELTVDGISASSAQRETITNQLTKDINVDQSLYQVGIAHQ